MAERSLGDSKPSDQPLPAVAVLQDSAELLEDARISPEVRYRLCGHPSELLAAEVPLVLITAPFSHLWHNFHNIRPYPSPYLLAPFFSLTDIWRLGALRGAVVVPPVALENLEEVLRRTFGAPAIRQLAASLTSGCRNVIVARAITMLLAPLSAWDGEHVAFSVAELGARLGASSSFLYRAAHREGLDLGEACRQARFLHGLYAYPRLASSWTRVAVALGFPSASAWGHFVRRLWGMSPTDAQGTPLPQWCRAAAMRIRL